MTEARTRHGQIIYAALTGAAMLLGAASRRYAFALPPLLHKNAGDVIWGLMVFLALSALLPRLSVPRAALGAATFAAGIEFFKLYDPPWLHATRATTIGWLVLGHGFHVSNLMCYGLGIAAGAVCAAMAEQRSFGSRHRSPPRPCRGGREETK